jgi:hypothetical protein
MPEITSTRPSGSVVALGYQRGKCMSATRVHWLVAGLKMFASTMPVSVNPVA